MPCETITQGTVLIHLKRDIELIEQVQRRFTKRLHGLSNYTYEEWLKTLNLKNLQSHRTRFNLTMCYKIIFGLVCVNADDFFEFRVSNTRGHSYKLYQQFSNVYISIKVFLRTRCHAME